MSMSSIGIFIDQVLSGLAFIHKQGMIHMDIKPDNILFTLHQVGPNETRRKFYIADLGLTSNTHSVRGPAGTPCYQSPESSRDDKVSIASDVYAFGIVLIEILGFWCIQDGYGRVSKWQEKLGRLGIKNAREYKDYVPSRCRDRSQQPTHSRIKSLVDYGIVRSAVGRVLDEDPRRRSPADVARRELLDVYPPAGNAGGREPPSPGIRRKVTGWGKKFKQEPAGREQDRRQPKLKRRDTGRP